MRVLKRRQRQVLVGLCLFGIAVAITTGQLAMTAALVFLAAWLELGKHLSTGAIHQAWAELLGRTDVLIAHATVFNPNRPARCLAAIDTAGQVRYDASLSGEDPERFMQLVAEAGMVLVYDANRMKARIGQITDHHRIPFRRAKWRCIANDYRTLRAGARFGLEQALSREAPAAKDPGGSALQQCHRIRMLMRAVSMPKEA